MSGSSICKNLGGASARRLVSMMCVFMICAIRSHRLWQAMDNPYRSLAHCSAIPSRRQRRGMRIWRTILSGRQAMQWVDAYRMR